MPDLPARFAALIITFAPLFVQRSWRLAQVLLIGAILAPGRRTVASVLRITGHAHDRHFTNYHRVLSRAPWSARDGARILLGHLVRALAPRGSVILGLDDTVERRWGPKIATRGIYRDPVRSSHSHFVKTSGLRWMSLMLLAPVAWAERVWALPFLTALVSSERYDISNGCRHKTLLDFGRQLALQARRWLPGRDLVLVADSSFSSLLFLHALQRRGLTVIIRLCLDAALYDPAPPRVPGTMGRPRKAGQRLATLAKVVADATTVWQPLHVEHWYGGGARDLLIASATAVWRHNGLPVVPIRWVLIRDPKKPDAPAQALLCTDLDRTPEEIVIWFVRRWRIETTFEEVRTHLGVETQRQWVRPRHRPHHAQPLGPVLHRHPAGPHPTGPTATLRNGRRLVPQSPPDLLRRPRGRPSRDLARTAFPDVTAANRPLENPLQAAPGLGLRPLQRGLKRLKSSLEPVR